MTTIRPATKADTAVLAALHTAGFEETWSPGAMTDLLAMPGAFALIAEEGDGPRGFVLAVGAAEQAEIMSIAVHPTARRRGFGRALLSAAAAAGRGTWRRNLFLEVAVDNPAALGLYTALGFAERGRRKAYYVRKRGPAVDALIMSKDLPSAA